MSNRIGLLCIIILFSISSCSTNKSAKLDTDSLDFQRGELALCGDPDFGQVNFGLTCNGEVQDEFNMAIALLHSFEYREAEKAFVRVIDADPQCAIAYWGVAMSNLHDLWAPPKEKDLKKCSEILHQARQLPTKSVKEAEYIEAISAFYTDWKNKDHKQRVNKYADEMKAIYEKYPDDKEAAVFYALALRSTADPADKTFAVQKASGELLAGLFPDQPDHPGIAHYLIHSYDYPELAELALDAARRYADIAPSSAHAQHMPSHIFTRLGLWEESINSNLKSAESAVCYSENMQMKGLWNQEVHALDYLMYAYLQLDKLDHASEVWTYVNNNEVADNDDFANAYALAAIPARYALERQKWNEAAHLEFYPPDFAWNNFPWERCIIYFTRCLGKAHLGDLDGARDELAMLNAGYNQLVEMENDYKIGQVDIQIKAAEAWIAFAEGDSHKALKLMRASANAEDETEKHPVTPGEVLPARELLGDMLMELEMFDEALVEYQAVLKKAPRRLRSTNAIKLIIAKQDAAEV